MPAEKSLSAVKVVSRAIQLADQSGIQALSMRKLAAEFSVTPMALYWYFPNKDALLDAMAEQVAVGLTFSDEPEAPWPDRLRNILLANLVAFRAHPWLPPLVKGRIVLAPSYLQILEALLDCVRSAGFGTVDAVRVAEYAMDCVAAISNTLAMRENPPRPPASREHLHQYRETVHASAEGYPRIQDAIVPLTEDENPERYVTLSIDILVRGIEARAGEARSEH